MWNLAMDDLNLYKYLIAELDWIQDAGYDCFLTDGFQLFSGNLFVY
jgi:hypothetical protein